MSLKYILRVVPNRDTPDGFKIFENDSVSAMYDKHLVLIRKNLIFCRNETHILLSPSAVEENDDFCEQNRMLQSAIRKYDEFDYVIDEFRKRQLNSLSIWNTVKK